MRKWHWPVNNFQKSKNFWKFLIPDHITLSNHCCHKIQLCRFCNSLWKRSKFRDVSDKYKISNVFGPSDMVLITLGQAMIYDRNRLLKTSNKNLITRLMRVWVNTICRYRLHIKYRRKQILGMRNMVIGCVLRKLSRISTCVDKPNFKMTKSLLEIFLV